MQKRIITLLCSLGLALSTPVLANSPQLRPDAPERYVVKNGDTLWGIASKYLQKPWQWPQLWGLNRAQVRNPQHIYPGQVLVLRQANGKISLGLENTGEIPTVKLSPKVRELSTGYGISTLDIDFYRMFMKHPQMIDPEVTRNAPQLVGGPDSRALYSKGDRVYAYGLTEPGEYLVYRVQGNVVDPKTNKNLGQRVIFSGKVSTLPLKAEVDQGNVETPLPALKIPNEVAQPLVVTEAVSEIRYGDKLLKFNRHDVADNNMTPHAPETPVQAVVVSVLDGVFEAGPYQTIAINKGTADGIDNGTVLGLYKQSRTLEARLDDAKGKSVVKFLTIPAEEVGLAMVYRAGEHTASALILDGLKTNITIGDMLANPGQDLGVLPVNYPHLPN